MTGRELTCHLVSCRMPAADVPFDFEIPPEIAFAWTCTAGHSFIQGWRAMTGKWDVIQLKPDNFKATQLASQSPGSTALPAASPAKAQGCTMNTQKSFLEEHPEYDPNF